AQATRDASPFRNRSAANGQNRRLRIPSRFSRSTMSKIHSPGEPHNATSGELAVVVIGFLKAGEAQTIVRASGGSI
ncbi:hypothetical protein, partial [Azospirillum sp. TSH58]|uniref:hypothetical protein n=1 Tax=Azospirillum sp. TSH58 TaxID=664962 RepID=UPI001B3BC55E